VGSDVLLRERLWLRTEMDHKPATGEAAPVQIQAGLAQPDHEFTSNAVEALPPVERRILVSTRSPRRRSGKVSVRDFGAGLPKDRPEKWFDHFFSHQNKLEGHGINHRPLHIEMHGGTISAENAAGYAERVSFFRLPAARGDVEKPGGMIIPTNRLKSVWSTMIHPSLDRCSICSHPIGLGGKHAFNKSRRLSWPCRETHVSVVVARHLDGKSNGLGGLGSPLRLFTETARYRHHGRATMADAHRHGHRGAPGSPFFHQTVSTMKISRCRARRSGSGEESVTITCPNDPGHTFF